MFSAGADLQAMLPAFLMAGVSAIDGAEAEMQQMMLRLRYASVPVISAITSGQPTPAEEELLLKTQMAGDEVPRPNIRVWVSTPQQ